MDNVLILVLALLGSAVAGYFAWRTHQKRREAWGAFAREHGLTLSARGLELRGHHERWPLHLTTETRGHGKHRLTVTVLRLTVGEALPGDFTLEREWLGDKLLKLLGRGDEEIGDAEFDDAFEIQNVSPEVRALLRSATVREHLHRLATTYRRFLIRAGALYVEQAGIPATVEALEAFVRPTLDAAAVLSTSAGRPRQGLA